MSISEWSSMSFDISAFLNLPILQEDYLTTAFQNDPRQHGPHKSEAGKHKKKWADCGPFSAVSAKTKTPRRASLGATWVAFEGIVMKTSRCLFSLLQIQERRLLLPRRGLVENQCLSFHACLISKFQSHKVSSRAWKDENYAAVFLTPTRTLTASPCSCGKEEINFDLLDQKAMGSCFWSFGSRSMMSVRSISFPSQDRQEVFEVYIKKRAAPVPSQRPSAEFFSKTIQQTLCVFDSTLGHKGEIVVEGTGRTHLWRMSCHPLCTNNHSACKNLLSYVLQISSNHTFIIFCILVVFHQSSTETS